MFIKSEKTKDILLAAAITAVCLICAIFLAYEVHAASNGSSSSSTAASVKTVSSTSTKAASSTAAKLVKIAESQVGNDGGEPYWSWYGYSYHVDWCACFVSWCANKDGLISSGLIPKFSYVPTAVNWFKEKDEWEDNDYTPQPGDIIFFDITDSGAARNSGGADHVGIVVACKDGYVYTVEGNRKDKCKKMKYKIGSAKILGYGVPNY